MIVAAALTVGYGITGPLLGRDGAAGGGGVPRRRGLPADPFGADHGAAALGGPYTAAFAFGSALGGIAYGARAGRFGPPPRAILVLDGLITVLCLPVLGAFSIAEMFVCAALAGPSVASLITVRNQLLQTSIPTGTMTEAFTWLSLAPTFGAGIGAAVGGPLIEAAGWRSAAAPACVLTALPTVVMFSRRRLLGEEPAHESAPALPVEA